MTSSRDFDTNHSPTDEQETRLFRERARASQSEACLVVISGARLGTRIILDGGEVVIGRDPASDFQIAERSVSRKHCKVIAEQDRHWIQDLESTNHTYLNGRRIERAALSDGDQIRICETTLKFIDAGNIEAEYHSELHESTIRDPLTGLFNRRHAMAVLDTEIARARRDSGYRLSIVILDIDFFKPLNDELGHLAGDRALKQLSELLAGRIRAGDTLARIGGEEFMLIAPDTPPDRARVVAEDLRRTVAETGFRFDGQTRRLTISGGVADWREGMRSASELLRAADQQLYQAKDGGRDRIR